MFIRTEMYSQLWLKIKRLCAIYFKFRQGGISEQASIQSISEKYLRHDTIENAWGSGISTKGANASRKKRNAGNRSKVRTIFFHN
jgi:hypothetical protein